MAHDSSQVSANIFRISRKVNNLLWWILTPILGAGQVAWGGFYLYLGDRSAGPAFYAIQVFPGLVTHAAITLAVGCLILCTLRSPAAPAALWLSSTWSCLTGVALLLGFRHTGIGPGGFIVWLVPMLLSSLVLMIAAPDQRWVAAAAGWLVRVVPRVRGRGAA
jgi:hypothetical protein